MFTKKHLKVRQLAPQSFNINSLVKSLSKEIFSPKNVQDFGKNYHKKLLSLTDSRPGPVWIDIPVDIQWSNIKLSNINKPNFVKEQKNVSKNKIKKFVDLIYQSKKPLLLIGSGIKLSQSEKEFIRFLQKK